MTAGPKLTSGRQLAKSIDVLAHKKLSEASASAARLITALLGLMQTQVGDTVTSEQLKGSMSSAAGELRIALSGAQGVLKKFSSLPPPASKPLLRNIIARKNRPTTK